MDFEEFRKSFELFSKIDSPQKMEVCRNQYEQFIARKESQQHFEPFTKKFEEAEFTDQYDIRLRKMLVTDHLNEEHVIFLVKPSFEPEYSLEMEKRNGAYFAKLRFTVENYWYQYYNDNSKRVSDMKMVECEVEKETGAELFKLSETAFHEAKIPAHGAWILDGVQYFFIRKINGEVKTIFKHSPDEDSKAGKIVRAFEDFCVKLKNHAG